MAEAAVEERAAQDAAAEPAAANGAPAPEAKPAEDAKAKGKQAKDRGEASQVLIGRNYKLLPNNPLPELDGPSGPAFQVRDMQDGRTCFAVLCQPGAVPRMSEAQALRRADDPGLMRVLEAAPVLFPGERRRRMAFVFEQPGGRRLMQEDGTGLPTMSEDHLARMVVQPLVSAFRELTNRGLFCGAIRPTNLFWRDLAHSALRIGEFVSAPPGFNQPLVFETLQRGMAAPEGRGPGLPGDDLYALGVTLMMVWLGGNPLRAATDAQILRAKMERGSFNTLLGRNRPPAVLVEPLRGLLNDDPDERWRLDDLEAWLEGRRQSPRQPKAQLRASRALDLGGLPIGSPAMLALSLQRQRSTSLALIDKMEIDRWLRRAVGSDELADRVDEAVRSAGSGRTGSVEDRILARVAIALNPTGPILYQECSLFPAGFATALAVRTMSGGDLQPLAAILNLQLANFWTANQTGPKAEYAAQLRTLDSVRGYLDRKGAGNGIERVFYELNPALPCLSPLVIDRYATTPSELLVALDAIAEEADRAAEPMDRHIAAFLAHRAPKVNSRLFALLDGPARDPKRLVALLSVLASVQDAYGPRELPDLAQWLGRKMEPAIERLKSRSTQETVRKALAKACDSGQLSQIVAAVDNPTTLARDESGFEDACQQYRLTEAEIAEHEENVRKPEKLAMGIGRQAAAVVSAILGTLLCAGAIVLGAGAL